MHIDDFQEYVDDCFLHAEKMRKEFPNIPMFVLGHSMVGLPFTVNPLYNGAHYNSKFFINSF